MVNSGMCLPLNGIKNIMGKLHRKQIVIDAGHPFIYHAHKCRHTARSSNIRALKYSIHSPRFNSHLI